MDQARPVLQPIGMTELVAGFVAILFAALAGGWLLADMASGQARALTEALAEPPAQGAQAACAGAPRVPVPMRLGQARVYPPPAAISLEPAPFSVSPVVGGEQAYTLSALHLTGCDSEELLAYYTSAEPAYQRVLSWVFVTTVDCPSAFPRSASDAQGPADVQRQCVSVSAFTADRGAPMGTRMFLEPAS